MTRAGMDLAELRRLAEAATPGPWRHSAQRPTGAPPADIVRNNLGRFRVPSESDAAYIAAANPATILALLDLLTVERLADALRSAPHPPSNIPDSDEWYRIRATNVLAALAASPDPEGPSDE